MSPFASRIRDLAPDARRLATGDYLFRLGERIERLHLVLEGEIALERISTEGHRLILQREKAGDVVAEASFFAHAYHCDAVCLAEVRVASIPIARLNAASQADPRIMVELARHLALQVQQTRARAEILSLRKVRDRLDAWLLLHEGRLPAKGRWQALANEISVAPEALYRELGRRAAPFRDA